ncbi:long chain fatty acid coenzyme A ligase 1 [Trichuris trichiura]|uniref:long-chain-fatty-acid--CoA ligase n=1 Tax=Trichuris trichiura TaxID=36087 RepID=A0A077ZIL3_TRITR|nr:long chain fatty acid coenzyme A ligase 1 [Trichuris trichiura]
MTCESLRYTFGYFNYLLFRIVTAGWLFSFDDALFKLLTLFAAFTVYRTIRSRNRRSKRKKQSYLSPSCQSILQPGPERIRTSVFKWADPDKTVTTVYEAFLRGHRLSADGKCLGYRPPNSSTYKWITYDDVLKQALSLGLALRKFENPAGNITPIGIYSSNRPEWFISSLAMTSQSIPIVPLYDTFGSTNLLHILENAELETVICENGAKFEKLMNIRRSGKTRLRRIILIDFDEAAVSRFSSEPTDKDVSVEKYADLMRRAESVDGQVDVRPPEPSTIHLICYTSGSTGSPKGVIITHRNSIKSAKSVLLVLTEQNLNLPHYSTYISYLPMAHIYEQTCQTVAVFLGKRIGFYSGNVSRLMDDMKALKPHWLPAVPRVLSRIHDTVWSTLKTQPLKRFLFSAAIRWKLFEYRLGIWRNDGIVDRLVFKRIRQEFGGRMAVCISGSAPTTPEVLNTCKAMLGCSVIEGYGQTESTGAVCCTFVDDLTSGHVGAISAEKEVKLVDVPELNYWAAEDKGEICIRGDEVTPGYYKDEQRTAEIIDKDGWLHTGDIGQWLPNGALKIIDRKKHIFKLSQGEYVAPENIENVYTRSPWISQIYVDGHSHQSYLVAVVVPEKDMLIQWASQEGLLECPLARGKDLVDLEQLCKVETVKCHILDQLRKTGASHGLNSLEQVRKIHLTTKPFTIEDGLLTPTLKNCRLNLRNRFRDTISDMYASAVN